VAQHRDLASGEADASRRLIRIVLADDNPEVLDEVCRFLAVEFHIVCTVQDGLALVSAASKWRPDIVVSDIDMPFLNGTEASRQILQQGYSKGAIALTMYNQPEMVRKCREQGILGYVLKVDARDELVPAVRRVLSGEVYLSRGVRKTAV
jgi:DNA-binding NarL/FixJ family response regulator